MEVQTGPQAAPGEVHARNADRAPGQITDPLRQFLAVFRRQHHRATEQARDHRGQHNQRGHHGDQAGIEPTSYPFHRRHCTDCSLIMRSERHHVEMFRQIAGFCLQLDRPLQLLLQFGQALGLLIEQTLNHLGRSDDQETVGLELP